MTTGLDIFDKTVQESNLWLKDIMERLSTNDRHHAYSTLRAVLHALRDRIGAESAAHLGAQLPMLLRGLYYEGWDPTGKPTKERHELAFPAHIARELPRADTIEVEEGVRAVLDVLANMSIAARRSNSPACSRLSSANSGLPLSRARRGTSNKASPSGRPLRTRRAAAFMKARKRSRS